MARQREEHVAVIRRLAIDGKQLFKINEVTNCNWNDVYINSQTKLQ
jgi:hypothetical protein